MGDSINKKPTRVGLHLEKSGFNERLNKALDKEGFPPKNKGRIQRLANMMGLSHRGAGKWLDGETTPPAKKIPFLAEKLDINFEWLSTGKGNMVREASSADKLPNPLSTREVPLYTVDDLHNPYRSPSQVITCYAASVGKTFALKVDTEAMSPRFPTGSILIIDTGRVAKDGDFVIAQTFQFPMPQFRQFFTANHMNYLEAQNPKFDRIIFTPNDKIIGVVIQLILLFH